MTRRLWRGSCSAENGDVLSDTAESLVLFCEAVVCVRRASADAALPFATGVEVRRQRPGREASAIDLPPTPVEIAPSVPEPRIGAAVHGRAPARSLRHGCANDSHVRPEAVRDQASTHDKCGAAHITSQMSNITHLGMAHVTRRMSHVRCQKRCGTSRSSQVADRLGIQFLGSA